MIQVIGKQVQSRWPHDRRLLETISQEAHKRTAEGAKMTTLRAMIKASYLLSQSDDQHLIEIPTRILGTHMVKTSSMVEGSKDSLRLEGHQCRATMELIQDDLQQRILLILHRSVIMASVQGLTILDQICHQLLEGLVIDLFRSDRVLHRPMRVVVPQHQECRHLPFKHHKCNRCHLSRFLFNRLRNPPQALLL
jgi:hypothetical protein